MSRKCGVCQLTGHTVRGCSDAGAGVALADLMSENNLERAKVLCRSMPTRYVSFALCHGFGVAVSGGRPKLLELIIAKFGPQPQVQAPVTPVPVPVTPPVQQPIPATEVQGVPMLMEMLARELNKNNELKVTLEELSHKHLRKDVTFLPNHPGTCDMSEYDLVAVRQNKIKQVANKVITMILLNIDSARIANPHLLIDSYVNNLLSDVAIIRNYISNSAIQLHVKLSVHAERYVVSCINLQNSERRIQYFTRRINQLHSAANRIPEQMKKLKTVITCSYAPTNEEATTCGVCFDDVQATHVVRTGCNHDFCADCMIGWAKQRGIKSFIQCPCCRAEIDEMTVGDKIEQVKLEQGLAPQGGVAPL